MTKDTTVLGEFVGNRVAEILHTTSTDQWYHVKSKENIADLGTRENATANDMNEKSCWQKGPEWMYLQSNQWPIDQDVGRSVIPEEFLIRQRLLIAAVTNISEPIIDFETLKGKSFNFVQNLTARVLRICKNKSFKNSTITPTDRKDAEIFMLKSSMTHTNKMLSEGKLDSLRPEKTADGIIQLGGRSLEGLKEFYGQRNYPILAVKDPIAYIWMKTVHEEDHTGVTRTVAKSRRSYWIVNARKLATKIRHHCYKCRLTDKIMAQQLMAPLPNARQMISPTFHEVSLDLFGPFEIRDTVKKRCRKKVWGMIIDCLVTRAVHIDITEDYSMDGVIETLRKFIALRGCPAVIHSDKGSQLTSASKVFENWTNARNIRWLVVPAEAQHQNGTSESLIKSIKRSLNIVIGSNVLSFSGLQMVFYEVADVINSRPIGVVSGSDPTQPEAITPNHLILGRSTSEIVTGSVDMTRDINKRVSFLNSLVKEWWQIWYESVLPSLVPSYKWLQRHRNVKIGDICLIKYANELKARYRLGKVHVVKRSADGHVRSVRIMYKNPGESIFREVDRPIHGIAIIVPIEEQASDIVSSLDPKAADFEPMDNTSAKNLDMR